jgi:hypothetical protein
VHQDRASRARVTTRMGHVALFVALAVVPVLALNSFATATPTRDGGTDPRPGPTDAQRQCLADQGATLPAPGTPAERSSMTDEQRKELRKAVKECGLRGPHVALRQLTDEQRQCLTDQGVTPPAPGSNGVRPQVSADQRDALRQAALSCGLPDRSHHDRGGADRHI